MYNLSFDKCTMFSPYSVTQNRFTGLKISHTSPVYPFLPPSEHLATSDLFTVSTVLHFFQNVTSVQFSCSVVSDSDPVDCSTPGCPVHDQVLELAQTHVHQVGDAIQPSYPLSSPSPPAFHLSQYHFPVSQFFGSRGQSIGVSASA